MIYSAVMAVDIRDEYIGIALGYHRHVKQSTSSKDSELDIEHNGIATTSINPLPPLPYMSRDPHHPSYSFRYRHKPVTAVEGMALKPPRVERTIEVALELAQLASQRSVKSVLVRWPGDGAALGLDGRIRTDNDEWTKGIEGGLLSGFSDKMNAGYKINFNGTLGYQRGRILYVLDKCCGVVGHNTTVSSTLLVEGSRPFAFWDTLDTQELITLSSRLDPSQQCEVQHSTSRNNERLDKYGNSLTEMDQWGRAPIFGMPPDCTWTQTSPKGISPSMAAKFLSSDGGSQFDHFHDAEAKIDQLKGSFAAMLTLRDFANAHLEGQVALQAWVKLHEDDNTSAASDGTKIHIGYRKLVNPQQKKELKHAQADAAKKLDTAPLFLKQENRGKLATLVQLPRKRRRNNSTEQSTQLKGI